MSTVFHALCMDFSFGHCPHFFLLIPIVISPVGYFFHFYPLCTQNISSLWVFLSLLLSLYPKYFISLGISSIFTLSIPKTFHLFGYFFRFYSLYTQNISSLWVFLPFSLSLYPKHFISLGISSVLLSLYPILFLLLGIPAVFFSLYPKCHAPCAYNGIPSFSFPAHPHKKNPALRDSPPAAGRINDIIPLRRSVLLPGGLYCFVWENQRDFP